ncbi:hypothetical protein [Kordiimonas aquimaris]|uniref:hypothetical protein n=1 Tax=Kordiimonas aquimaris TaxID=707591 RepID=UPI0021CE03A7|nr:hypothetical protein [Kordiimonas aquimaris]
MTRNMIFGAAIGGIAVMMVIGSLMSDNNGRNYDRDGMRIAVDIDIDDESVVISSDDGRTVVHTKDGTIKCGRGDDDITITREDGSQTRIQC